jgi:CBS-domain-containing membrane protein
MQQVAYVLQDQSDKLDCDSSSLHQLLKHAEKYSLAVTSTKVFPQCTLNMIRDEHPKLKM